MTAKTRVYVGGGGAGTGNSGISVGGGGRAPGANETGPAIGYPMPRRGDTWEFVDGHIVPTEPVHYVTISPILTLACGAPFGIGTWVTDDPTKVTCENCKKVKK